MQSTTRQSRGRGDQSPPKPSLSTLFTLEQPHSVTGGAEALKPEPFNTNSVYFTSATASRRTEQRLPWWELRNRWWVFSCSIPTHCGVMRLFQKPAHLDFQGPWKERHTSRKLFALDQATVGLIYTWVYPAEVCVPPLSDAVSTGMYGCTQT